MVCRWTGRRKKLIVLGASFAENFYGMKRVLLSSNKMPSTFKERIPSIIILVVRGCDRLRAFQVWPYMRDRLENLQKKLEATGSQTVGSRQILM